MKKIFLFAIILSLFSAVSLVHAESTSTDSIATTTPLATITAIRGGNNYDSAISIDPGSYHLDHNQKNGDYDYFKISVTQSLPVTITLITSDKAIGYDENTKTFIPSKQINAGLKIQDKDRTDLGKTYSVEANAKNVISYTPTSTGFIYLLVGPLQDYYSNAYYSMDKSTVFQIEVVEPSPTVEAVVAVTPVSTAGNGDQINPSPLPQNGDFFSLFSTSLLDNTTLLYVLIGIGLLILLLLLILIAKVSRKKKLPQTPPQMMPPMMLRPNFTPPSSMPPPMPASLQTPPTPPRPTYTAPIVTPPVITRPPVQTMPVAPTPPPAPKPAYAAPVPPPITVMPSVAPTIPRPAPVTPVMPTPPAPIPMPTPPPPPVPPQIPPDIPKTMPPVGL
ncbi:MAG: hypothetical protein PHV93_01670 [Candidatus Pacebacteria bacterium]|nr:hypothetical protein [Candidatus Paceibacterota bacterium]